MFPNYNCFCAGSLVMDTISITRKRRPSCKQFGWIIKAIRILLISFSLKKYKSPRFLPSTKPNLVVSASAISKTASITWLDILLHSFSSFKSN